MGNPETALIECLYNGNKTSAILAVGETITVGRQDIVTIITRVSIHTFKVESRKKVAYSFIRIALQAKKKIRFLIGGQFRLFEH